MSGSSRLTELADQDVAEGPEVGRQLLGADPFQHLSQKQDSHLKIRDLSKGKSLRKDYVKREIIHGPFLYKW